MFLAGVLDVEDIGSDRSCKADPPKWTLDDLYLGINDPSIEADLEQAAGAARALEENFKGRLAEIDGDAFGWMIEDYERIEEQLGRVLSFAQLLHSADRNCAKIGQFFQSMQERTNEIDQNLLFVTLEINRINEDCLAIKLDESENLRRYRPWLDRQRSFRPHQLDDDAERMLHEKSIVGRNSWMRLFDQMIAEKPFELNGDTLNIQQGLNLLSSPDRTIREDAAHVIAAGLEQDIKTFALITNTLAKDKHIEDRWRNFARPISARNLANQVEDDVVDALVNAVKSNYPRLSHRYYNLKARWMGLEKLEYWDRNAPLPDDKDDYLSFSEAQTIVLDAYRQFEPSIANIVSRFFEAGWIDADVRQGKDSGAFCHPTVTSVHPYVLMNYQGKNRDVMTLAHELGHAVHQTLAAEQGLLCASTPLTLAETASVFGEQLTFQSLLKRAQNPSKRRILLASKIEDMLNTVVRQIAFVDFEHRVHLQRKKNELTPAQLGEIWLNVQRESLGDTFNFDDEYRVYWSYIPHFIHVPFYVYAYAFGDCLVNSLFSVYQQSPDGFTERYLTMLKAGGTLHHRELLAPFGLDAADPDFWNHGLDLLAGMIDQLEQDFGDID